MSSLYGVHAVSVGKAVVTASRGTIDAALREAKLLLRSGHDFVWIVDGEGNVILPAGEIRARLNGSSGKNGRRREAQAAVYAYRATTPFDHYLAERSVSLADRSPDEQFRFFLIDLAATRCALAQEFLDEAPTEPERLRETAKMAPEVDSVDAQAAPLLEGLEPRMVSGPKRRNFH
jgi:hypothetical protein